MEQRYFLYGDEVIYYSRTHRLLDNDKLLVKVHDDGRVVAHAPLSASEASIKFAISKRARWIWKQLGQIHFTRAKFVPRQYISGESHFYLGRRHVLKVITVGGVGRKVKLLRGKFEVSVQLTDTHKDIKKLLNDWYKQRAEEVFKKRLDVLLPQTPWVQEAPKLRLQQMTKQWGSCSADNVLTLNTHLVKAPRNCIDYVILHELCHIVEHNHSERFYRLLYTAMPDWEERKVYLDQQVYAFLT